MTAAPAPMPTWAWRLPLPPRYRSAEFWQFHRRDPQQLAERVEGQSLLKGLVWQGQPACLRLELGTDAVAAQLQRDGAGAPIAAGSAEDRSLQRLVRRMLGLAYPPADFEARFAGHAQLGPLLHAQAGLHVPASSTPFEALTWAITGQQISVAAAVSLRRRLVQVAGRPLGRGDLWAYPDAAQVAALDLEALRAAGFSQAKAATLLAVSTAVAAGDLPLDAWAEDEVLPVDAITAALLATKGIGPWTVHYALLRGYGWPDGSLHGDVAVRRALARLLGEEALSPAQTQAWLQAFAPWRALVGAHLWASLATGAY